MNKEDKLKEATDILQTVGGMINTTIKDGDMGRMEAAANYINKFLEEGNEQND